MSTKASTSTEVMRHKDISNQVLKEQRKKARGYTLEEIRYQRAVVALQKEFCKEKIVADVNKVKNRGSVSSNSNSGWGKVGNVVSRLAGGLNYLDYAMLGFSLIGYARKIFKTVKRRK